jgi:hypothetical protein
VPVSALFIWVNAGTRNIDPQEALRYFSWVRFIIIAVIYTAFVFWLELAKDGPFIFSSRNARSRSYVFRAHAMFLTILFCCFRISIFIVPSLPFWMTDTFVTGHGNRGSIADIFLCLAAFGMAYFERKWLYRKLESNFGTSGDSFSNE